MNHVLAGGRGRCAAAVLIATLGAAGASAQSRMTNAQLAQKAHRIQKILETKTLQVHGMVPMFVRKTDYQLPTAEDYAGIAPHRHMRGRREADLGMPPMHVWRAWENTTSNTALYLAALSFQYRATGDPKVLRLCRRTFAAVKYIFDLGAQDEPGFVTKPYGGKYNKQSSGDQVQCLMVGLQAYRDIASPQDRAALDKMFPAMADLQIKYRYSPKHGYFGHPFSEENIQKNLKDWSYALIFIPVLQQAWYSTGEVKYVREIQGWYERCGVRNKYRVPDGKSEIRGNTAYRMFYLPSLMMERDPANEELWRSMMLSRFREIVTGIQPDGTTYTSWTHNFATGKTTPRDPGYGGGPTRSGRVSLFAWACVNSQRWFPKESMVDVARRILEGLDMDTFRFILPVSDGRSLPADWKIEGELIDHDSLTGWMLAYWEGRWRGLW